MSSLSKAVEFLKIHRERAAVTGLLIGLIVFIVLGLSLQKKGRELPVKPEADSSPAKVELKLKEPGTDSSSPSSGTAAFFLKPSPVELLSQLESMKDLNEDVVTARFTGLKVYWPVYFFSLDETEGQDTGKRTLTADVSEDGFGIIVKADIALVDFPQLEDVKEGMKIWVAGEIQAIDPAGTGVIYMSAEHVRTGAEPFAGKTEQDKK